MIRWQSQLDQVPLEAWAFVHANSTPYALFLSLRPDGRYWRGFVLANARNHADLLQVRWSADVRVFQLEINEPEKGWREVDAKGDKGLCG